MLDMAAADGGQIAVPLGPAAGRRLTPTCGPYLLDSPNETQPPDYGQRLMLGFECRGIPLSAYMH